MLRVAITGAGGLGARHADNYANIPDTRVALIHDSDQGRARDLAGQVGAEATTDAAALAGDDIDVVVVCTPTPSHSDYVIMAAQAGKHVFTEKPMARTMEQGRAMLAAVAEAGVTFMVGHVVRWFPEYASAREIIQSGDIGEVAVARVSRINTQPTGVDAWFKDYAQSGGVLLDMAIHDIDWLLWTLGPAERVYGVGCPDRMPLLDYALVTIRFRSGAIAHVEGSWADLGQFRTSFDIAGSGGLLRHDSTDNATLIVQKREAAGGPAGTQMPQSPAAVSPYLLEDRHFVDCILTGSEPMVSGADALAATELALAGLQSIESGGEVIEL